MSSYARAERTLRHLTIGMLIGGCSVFLLARCSEAATLRVSGLPAGCKPVLRDGRDYVVQCPDPKKPGAWRDVVTIPGSVVCPKPPRTEARTTDGGLLVDCHR